MVPRTAIRPPPDDRPDPGHRTGRDRLAIVGSWPNLLIEDGGPTLPGRIATTRRRYPRRARQLTSQASTGCFEVRGVPAAVIPPVAASARVRAQSRPRPGRRRRRRRDPGPHHLAAADDRPPRRPRADRPGGAGGRAVHRQPAWAPSPVGSGRGRSRSWRSIRGIGAASLLLAVRRCRSPPVMVAVAIVFWVSLSFGGPFHLRLWGVMYPARLRGRVVGFVGHGPRGGDGARGARRRRHRRPARRTARRSRSAGLVGVACCAVAYAGLRAPAAARPPRFSARDSIRALRERPVLGADRPRPGLLRRRAHRRRCRCTPSSTSTGSTCASATSASSASWPRSRRRSRSRSGARSRIGRRARRAAPRRRCSAFASLVGYALAPDVAVLWVAAVAGGAAGARSTSASPSIVSEQTSLASRSAAMAGWNAITGARGIVAAFAHERPPPGRASSTCTSGLLLCAVVSGRSASCSTRAERRRRRSHGHGAGCPRSVPAGSTVPTGSIRARCARRAAGARPADSRAATMRPCD